MFNNFYSARLNKWIFKKYVFKKYYRNSFDNRKDLRDYIKKWLACSIEKRDRYRERGPIKGLLDMIESVVKRAGVSVYDERDRIIYGERWLAKRRSCILKAIYINYTISIFCHCFVLHKI